MTVSSGIHIKFSNMRAVQAKMKRVAKEDQRKAARRATASMANIFKRDMLSKVPVRSGNLRRHIKQSIRKAKSFTGFYGRIGVLGNRRKKDFPFYARFLFKGAGAHTIENVAFGGKVFASVEHPGIKGSDLIQESFDENKTQAAAKAKKTFEDMIVKAWK